MFVIISGFLGPVGDGWYLGPLAQCLALSVVGHYFVLTTGMGGHGTELRLQDRLMWECFGPSLAFWVPLSV